MHKMLLSEQHIDLFGIKLPMLCGLSNSNQWPEDNCIPINHAWTCNKSLTNHLSRQVCLLLTANHPCTVHTVFAQVALTLTQWPKYTQTFGRWALYVHTKNKFSRSRISKISTWHRDRQTDKCYQNTTTTQYAGSKYAWKLRIKRKQCNEQLSHNNSADTQVLSLSMKLSSW